MFPKSFKISVKRSNKVLSIRLLNILSCLISIEDQENCVLCNLFDVLQNLSNASILTVNTKFMCRVISMPVYSHLELDHII